MASLAAQTCVPCRQGAAPATEQEKAEWIKGVPGWKIVAQNGIPELERAFAFDDFAQALDFTVRLGGTAEEQDHHPAILLEWGQVTVRWSTHKIKNLHKNDFVMAAKTDALYSERSQTETHPS